MSKDNKMTLWEIFQDSLKPAELRVFNPLEARLSSSVLIDTPDLFEKRPVISELDVYIREIKGERFVFTDYVLQGDGEWWSLRADKELIASNQLLLLTPDNGDGTAYDEVFHKETLPSGKLEVRDADGTLLGTYTRLHGLSDPYEVVVGVVKDQTWPPAEKRYSYWDFSRKLDDGETEYYFVEMDAETGWFKTFRGKEITTSSVKISQETKGGSIL